MGKRAMSHNGGSYAIWRVLSAFSIWIILLAVGQNPAAGVKALCGWGMSLYLSLHGAEVIRGLRETLLFL